MYYNIERDSQVPDLVEYYLPATVYDVAISSGVATDYSLTNTIHASNCSLGSGTMGKSG